MYFSGHFFDVITLTSRKFKAVKMQYRQYFFQVHPSHIAGIVFLFSQRVHEGYEVGYFSEIIISMLSSSLHPFQFGGAVPDCLI